MSEVINLSYSRLNTYETCPKLFKYKYIDKIPSNTPKSSALAFGSLIDEVLNILLLKKKSSLSEEEKSLLEVDIYDHYQTLFTELIRNEKDLTFFKADFDMDLLKEENFEELKLSKKEIEKYALDKKSSYHRKINEMCLFNLGINLIKLYEKDIMPRIGVVEDIQVKVDIKNERGDSIRGVIDFIGYFKRDDKLYIIDNKTSRSRYKENHVELSDQLATYAEARGISNAAFVVLLKKRYKKKPHYKYQIVKGKISEEHKNKIFTKYENLLDNVIDENFSENWKACRKQFGRKCDYFDLCHKGNEL